MRDYPQHEDLGLVDDDNTEDLRKENAPAGAGTPTRATNQTNRLKGSS